MCIHQYTSSAAELSSGCDVAPEQKRNNCLRHESILHVNYTKLYCYGGARCSSVVRAYAHGVMDRRIDPLWGEPIELFLVPASAPRLWDGAYKRTLAVNRKE